MSADVVFDIDTFYLMFLKNSFQNIFQNYICPLEHWSMLFQFMLHMCLFLK